MTLRPPDFAEVALVIVAGTIGASLAPALPFVGVPISATALGWLAYKHGFAPSVIAALATAVAGTLLAGGWQALAFNVPVLVAAGPGCAWALMRWPSVRTIVLLGVAMFAAGVLYQTLVGMGEGRSFLASQRFQAAQAGALMVAILKATGSTDTVALEKTAEQYARTSYLAWPSMFAYTYALAAALAVPLVSRMASTLGRTVNRLPALADLDLSLHIVWPAIAGLAIVAVATFMRQTESLLWGVGFNLLLLARMPLFVQGLGDFAALYRKAKVGRIGRAFGFTFLTISEVVIPSVSVVGLVDLFANLRRLPRRGPTPRTGLEGGPGSV